MWKCPACETLNNEDVCVICGEPKPTAEEIAQMEREEREKVYSPPFVAEKTTTTPYKEIITGESLKKWAKYIAIVVVIALAIWGMVACYNTTFNNPESVIEDFEHYVDINSSAISDVFPEPVQRLDNEYSSALYEMRHFVELLNGTYTSSSSYSYSSVYTRITEYDLEVISKTKCKGAELYQAESNLNDNINQLHYATYRDEYIDIDGAYKLYVKKDVTRDYNYGNTVTDTDYFEIYVYKIDGEWYLDYNTELFSY